MGRPHRGKPMTAHTTHSLTAAATITLLLTSLVACGPAPVERIASRQVDAVPGPAADASEDGTASDEPMALEIYALNADRTRIALLLLQLDAPGALPVGEPIAVDPEGDVRVVVRASGVVPQQSPVCQFIDNPLPEDVNPCAESIVLYASPRVEPLTGVLELTANDDVLAGSISAFWRDDDAVFGSFSLAVER